MLEETIPCVVGDLKRRNLAILVADTGLGKSTDVPVMLHESFPTARIIVVEKRRVAARELCKRVESRIGDRAGYSIGGESRHLETARILYVTDAMIWRKSSLDQ